MAETVAEARQEVVDARRGVESELDGLGSAVRGAVDIPAKIRRNPVKTVGIASGAAFPLALAVASRGGVMLTPLRLSSVYAANTAGDQGISG